MKFKYILHCLKWFDKVNGNTYFSAVITDTVNGEQVKIPYQYGYGNHFYHLAKKAVIDLNYGNAYVIEEWTTKKTCKEFVR